MKSFKNDNLFSPQALLEFVKKNEVVWQKRWALIECSCVNSEICIKKEQDEQNFNDEIISVLEHATKAQIFSPKTDDVSGFEDLVGWSNEKDLLILIDDEWMLCIAPSDKEQVLLMVA